MYFFTWLFFYISTIKTSGISARSNNVIQITLGNRKNMQECIKKIRKFDFWVWSFANIFYICTFSQVLPNFSFAKAIMTMPLKPCIQVFLFIAILVHCILGGRKGGNGGRIEFEGSTGDCIYVELFLWQLKIMGPPEYTT